MLEGYRKAPYRRTLAPFRWAGGKWKRVTWLLEHLPGPEANITTYVEPFGGAASLFFSLPKPYPVEVINDIDGDIVNLFRVLQDPEKFRRFAHRVLHTPYARDEWRRARAILDGRIQAADDVERAWAFYVATNMSFSGQVTAPWGFVISTYAGSKMPKGYQARTTLVWDSRLAHLMDWHSRVRMAQIENDDAVKVIARYDSTGTFFYVDPPYVPSVRKYNHLYRHEFTEDDHMKLVDLLLQVEGKVMLSGYPNPIYERLEKAGWVRASRQVACHAAVRSRGSRIQGNGAAMREVPRVEAIWMNYRVVTPSLPARGSGRTQSERRLLRAAATGTVDQAPVDA
jgi:DNA adenine methylase